MHKIREPWEQRLDETDSHYRQFLWWRDQVPRPPPSDPVLAHQYDWSTRCAAWDSYQSVPRDLHSQVSESLAALGEVVVLQARRLLDRTRTEPSFELDPKKLSDVTKSLVQVQLLVLDSGQRLGGDSIDTSGTLIREANLTDDECRVLLKMLEAKEKKR